MPRLADRWLLVAPDYPGAGYSATPDGFDYSFDGYAVVLDRFVKTLGLDHFALYLHDFGSPIGARLAMLAPHRVTALIIQNGDVPYDDALGPKYADIEATWALPPAEMRLAIGASITEASFQEEFLNHGRPDIAERISPDLWTLHWSLMTARRKEVAIDLIAGLKQNRFWFAQHRQYLAKHQPPTLIVWGPEDHYMPERGNAGYIGGREIGHRDRVCSAAPAMPALGRIATLRRSTLNLPLRERRLSWNPRMSPLAVVCHGTRANSPGRSHL